MSIKDILVFLDDGAANSQRTDLAFALSKANGAELTGASLASMKPIYAKLDGSDSIARVAEKQAYQLVDDFNQSASQASLSVNSIVISGDAPTSARKMARYARNTDLVVLGQPDPSKDNYHRLQEFTQDVMLFSGRPILFVPYIGVKRFPFEKALIAWDGTPAVSRAIHDAIPLLAMSNEVIILVVESEKQKAFKNDLLVEGLVKHLSNHGINAQKTFVNPGKSSVATTILNQVTDDDMDLLVLGGYGTPTLKQKIFGGVSTTLLSSMIVPVLMSH